LPELDCKSFLLYCDEVLMLFLYSFDADHVWIVRAK
jgi:hypothetical protein